jgi:hypothetical protein
VRKAGDAEETGGKTIDHGVAESIRSLEESLPGLRDSMMP